MTLLALAVITAAVVTEWVVRPALNPLRQSFEAVAAWVLERTPPGATRDEVRAWADARGWHPGGRPYPLAGEPPVQRVVGEYTSLGFTVVVFAEWVFDEGRPGPVGRGH